MSSSAERGYEVNDAVHWRSMPVYIKTDNVTVSGGCQYTQQPADECSFTGSSKKVGSGHESKESARNA